MILPCIPSDLHHQIEVAIKDSKPLKDSPHVNADSIDSYIITLTRLVSEKHMIDAHRSFLRAASDPELIIEYLHFAAQRTAMIKKIILISDSEYADKLMTLSNHAQKIIDLFDTMRPYELMLPSGIRNLHTFFEHWQNNTDTSETLSTHLQTEESEANYPSILEYLRYIVDQCEDVALRKPSYAWKEKVTTEIPRKISAGMAKEFMLRRELSKFASRLFKSPRDDAVARTVETALEYAPEKSVSREALRKERQDRYPRFRYSPSMRRIPT